MTDREKLMGLIQCAYAVHTQYASDGRPIGRYVRRAVADDHSVAVLTDILLDSGVTVHKTAHWKHRKGWDKYVCSECGYEHDEPHNYCPNPKCNAKMEGK